MKTIPLACLLLAALSFAARPQDTDKLAAIFIPGEEWQVAAENLGFADGLCCDAEGNVYFCDMRAKPAAAIFKLAPDGTKTKVLDAGRSGTHFGPDGRLYTVGDKKCIVYDLAAAAPAADPTVLAEGISTNDLTVSSKGFIYLTEFTKKQITLINPKTKEVKAVDLGIAKPNGIALSPDQKTLYVSDYAGINVWAFTVQSDGTLADKKPLMTMKAPDKTPDNAGGDGMTVDSEGRAYVTTNLGVQIFAPTGELIAALPKLQAAGSAMSITFGGKEMNYLYVSNGDKIYRRKTLVKGVLSFGPPLEKK